MKELILFIPFSVLKRDFHSLRAREICTDSLFPTKSAWKSILFDVIKYFFAGARSKMVNENHA